MVDSDWWVGVALPPLLEVAGWIGIELVDWDSGASPTALDFVPAVFVVVSMLLIPVFAVSLYFDARAVARSAESWSPNYRLWGVVGIAVPVVGFVLVDSPLLLFVGSAYLLRRWRSTDASVDVASDVYDADGWYDDDSTANGAGDEGNGALDVEDGGPSEAEPRPRSDRISRWYYGVALTIATYVVVLVSAPIVLTLIGVQENAAFLYDTVPAFAALLPFVLVLALVLGVLLIPVFSVSLYLDARAVGESDVGWEPNRTLWAAVGVVHLLNVLVPMIWLLSVPAGGYYLWQRHERVGRP
ncbi:hypothetical protein [Halobellus rufus]|uniref:hypothetical protein n=1 Tax=Halobellus rufus TaxID=1448860 RepID=UPI000679DD24|nr:hypothetical protein [Halobellus rufus]